MNKDLIEDLVRRLLSSAKMRGTQQGVSLYASVLEMLAVADTQEDVQEVKERLNHALAGIEAHGFFTEMEFDIVRKLRASP